MPKGACLTGASRLIIQVGLLTLRSLQCGVVEALAVPT